MRGTKRALALVIAVGCGGGGGDPPDADTPDARTDASTEPWAPGDVIVIGGDPGNDEDPAALLARDGSIYVAWFSEAAGFDILISRTTNGSTWSAPVHISSGAPRDFGPTLYQDAAGYIHAVWFRWELGAPPGHLIHNRTMAPDDGLAWSAATENPVTGTGAWDDWVPSIAADASGTMTVAFARNTCPPPNECFGIYTTTSTDGAAWTAPSPLVLADATQEHHLPALASIAGELRLVWDPFDVAAAVPWDGNRTGAYVATMRLGPGGWTDRLDVTARSDDEVSVFPTVFADHAGAGQLAWISGAALAASYVDLPVADIGTGTPRTLLEIGGYSAKFVATANPGVYLVAWVQGPVTERDVAIRVLTLP